MPDGLPDPALVVLIGASGAGKSTWAQSRYRAQEIVSSDELRGIVGSGRHDLDASDDAFTLLDAIVAARMRRGLTCVIDTLGLDAVRRQGYLDRARSAGLPAVAILFDVAASLVRARNGQRERPVPAPVLTAQLRRAAQSGREVEAEGWDRVVRVTAAEAVASTGTPDQPLATRPLGPVGALGGIGAMGFVLQVSRFPWDDDPGRWLKDIAAAAQAAGFAGLALMDHLIQIPQVDRAWAPIPEPWVTLGLLAGLDTGLSLGTLVSPVTFRPAGITAKAAATLDVITGGRAFLGLGAGWWEREHLGFGLAFPPARARLDGLESAIETIRALWSAGTKAHAGDRVSLPETTCYPRPTAKVPIIVGGSGERRTLAIAARLADACNLSSDEATLERKIAVLHGHCAELGRDRDEVAITVLDLPLVGRDRDEVWTRGEALRGRTTAAAYAKAHHAGTYPEQRERYARLQRLGVRTVFVAPPHLKSPQDVLDLAPMLR